MPITGTPAQRATPSDAQCLDQKVVRPVTARPDGVESPARPQAVRLAAGQAAVARWVLRDQLGNPVDVSGCGLSAGPSSRPVSSSSSSSSSSESSWETTPSEVGAAAVQLRLREYFSPNPPDKVSAYVVDPGVGLVEAAVPKAVAAAPGVYAAEWGVFDQAGGLTFSTGGYLICEPGLFADARSDMPSVAEIRTHLRDSGPEDNYLIDDNEYDLGELAASLVRAVMTWNETMSFVRPKYTTYTFPYKSQWINGTIGYLMLLAAHNYDRNLQEYSAGGTSMRDKAKGNVYLQKGTVMVQEYSNWVKTRKAQLNMEGAYGTTGRYY